MEVDKVGLVVAAAEYRCVVCVALGCLKLLVGAKIISEIIVSIGCVTMLLDDNGAKPGGGPRGMVV